MDRMEVREELAHRISSFQFETLPQETRDALQVYLSGLLTDSMIENREVLTGLVADWSRQGSRIIIKQILQMNVRSWINDQHPELKQEMARFIKRYLNRELEAVVRQVLPALDIGQMIQEKLDQFSVKQLEQMIYDVCRRELRWLAFLGAFLGFWLGLVSNLVIFWLPRP
jgi:uncharacterized membrane protein YheB (UPF0754 family)